jgi:3-mercaptopyruvate sulfurtransferase SseA
MLRKNPIPWILISAGLLVIFTAFAYSDFYRSKDTMPTPTPATVSQVQRVTLEEAKTAYDAGSVIFLDVRDSSLYAVAHILGAKIIPVSELTTRLFELDPKTWIIPYCT